MMMVIGAMIVMAMIVMMIVVMVVSFLFGSKNFGSRSRMRSRSKALRPSTWAMSICARSVRCSVA